MKLKYLLLTSLTLSCTLLNSASAQSVSFNQEDVCKATIALLMVQKPSIMTAHQEGNTIVVSYNRPSDRQRFVNRCRIDESTNKVVWAAKFDDGWGRWRDGRLDPTITYRINNDAITVDEDGYSKTFKHGDF